MSWYTRIILKVLRVPILILSIALILYGVLNAILFLYILLH